MWLKQSFIGLHTVNGSHLSYGFQGSYGLSNFFLVFTELVAIIIKWFHGYKELLNLIQVKKTVIAGGRFDSVATLQVAFCQESVDIILVEISFLFRYDLFEIMKS